MASTSCCTVRTSSSGSKKQGTGKIQGSYGPGPTGFGGFSSPDKVLAASSWTSSFLSLSMSTTSCCRVWLWSEESRKQWRNQKYCVKTRQAARAAQGSPLAQSFRVSITYTAGGISNSISVTWPKRPLELQAPAHCIKQPMVLLPLTPPKLCGGLHNLVSKQNWSRGVADLALQVGKFGATVTFKQWSAWSSPFAVHWIAVVCRQTTIGFRVVIVYNIIGYAV